MNEKKNSLFNRARGCFQVAEILYTLYANEINVRIENDFNSGFYASSPIGMYSRNTPYVQQSHQSRIISETTDSFLQRLTSTQTIDWRSRYNASTIQEAIRRLYFDQCDKQPALLDSTNSEFDVTLDKTLTELHRQGALFRIESCWDLGYDIYILDPSIRPTRVQIDNYNDQLKKRLDKRYYYEEYYLPSPEKDWLYKKSASSVGEIDEWFISFLRNNKIETL